MKISASAPGNLFLMGEHAVLHNEPAIVLAVNKRIHLELTPRKDSKIRVMSELGQYEAAIDRIEDNNQFNFLIAALRSCQTRLPSGFDLAITSEFSHQVGLGSSAAVTVACVAALEQFVSGCFELDQIFDRSLTLVHQVQNGRGSGADLAASVYGGLLGYRVLPRVVPPLPGTPEISLHYVGYKMKTPEVIAQVAAISAQHPQLYAELYQLMGQTTEQAIDAVQRGDWAALGRLMNFYAGLMDALGVCDLKLAELQYQLRAQPEVMGSKISGSGLGDSVITLGSNRLDIPNYLNIPVAVSPQGLEVRVDG